MSTYRFRLETLLKLRIAVRDERQNELAEALRAAGILQERRAQLLAEMAELDQESRRAASAGTVDVDRLAGADRHSVLLQANLRTISKQEAQLAVEIERRRLALVEADRQVRILEKLREHQLQQHEDEQLKKEARLLDDLTRPRSEDSLTGRI